MKNKNNRNNQKSKKSRKNRINKKGLNGKTKRKLSWQKPLIGLVLLIFAIIVLMKFAELQNIALLLKKANVWWFSIALISQFAVFACLAGMYKFLLGKKRNYISFWYLLKTSLAIVFVDYTLPSFSASGNILLYHVARKKKIKEGLASLLVALNVFLNLIVYLIVLIAGLAYLLMSKQIISLKWIWIPIILITACFILLTRILFTENGQHRFEKVMKYALHKWPGAKRKTLKHLSKLFKAKKELKKSTIGLAFAFTFLVYLFKITAIWAVFLSLGYLINPGVLIIGFAITVFLSVISYIKIGVYELVMIGAYTGFGIEYNLVLTATLLYRAIAFWLPMLFGFIFFKFLIKNTDKSKELNKNHKKRI